jgi:ribosome-binding factor A
MSGKRTQRVGDLLRDEIADILRTSIRDPRLELVSVTAVEVSGDLQHARVFMSSADPEADFDRILGVLRGAARFMRAELGRRRLDLRHLPELQFVHDQSIARGSRIEEILRDIHAAESAGSESTPPPDPGRSRGGPPLAGGGTGEETE